MATKPHAKTIADFRAAHDPNVIVPAKIRKVLDAMTAEGPENWEYENEIIKRAGINTQQMRDHRDQFAAHIIVAPRSNTTREKNVWFASVKVAAKMRGE